MELTDDELEGVAGGAPRKRSTYQVDCICCGTIARGMKSEEALLCIAHHELKNLPHKCTMTYE